MEHWRGKVRAEGLEMVAFVHIRLPACNKLGQWHGDGISEKYWKSLSKHNLVETNIGTIKILKQISDPGGLFSIEFKGIGIPQGPLAKEIKSQIEAKEKREGENSYEKSLKWMNGMKSLKSLKEMKGLVIDDEPLVLDVVSKYLTGEGYKVITAPNVKTALNFIEEKDFDFLICDINMPEMDGSDFYRIVKGKNPLLANRIIFLTGDVLSDKTKMFVDSTANPHIEKPFKPEELKEVIALVVSKKVSL